MTVRNWPSSISTFTRPTCRDDAPIRASTPSELAHDGASFGPKAWFINVERHEVSRQSRPASVSNSDPAPEPASGQGAPSSNRPATNRYPPSASDAPSARSANAAVYPAPSPACTSSQVRRLPGAKIPSRPSIREPVTARWLIGAEKPSRPSKRSLGHTKPAPAPAPAPATEPTPPSAPGPGTSKNPSTADNGLSAPSGAGRFGTPGSASTLCAYKPKPTPSRRNWFPQPANRASSRCRGIAVNAIRTTSPASAKITSASNRLNPRRPPARTNRRAAVSRTTIG